MPNVFAILPEYGKGGFGPPQPFQTYYAPWPLCRGFPKPIRSGPRSRPACRH